MTTCHGCHALINSFDFRTPLYYSSSFSRSISDPQSVPMFSLISLYPFRVSRSALGSMQRPRSDCPASVLFLPGCLMLIRSLHYYIVSLESPLDLTESAQVGSVQLVYITYQLLTTPYLSAICSILPSQNRPSVSHRLHEVTMTHPSPQRPSQNASVDLNHVIYNAATPWQPQALTAQLL